MVLNRSTRREFIKLASMAAASVALGCISSKFEDGYSEEGRDPKDYPVVVIGSGIGGLASAVYLSKAGFPVTVLEQHSIPGGYATAFQRGGFSFDVSLHFFGLQESMYQELGIDGKVERIPIYQTFRTVSKDSDITIPELSEEDYIEFICNIFSREQQGIRNYYEYCVAVYDELMRFSENMEKSFIFLPLMPFRYPKMWELRKMSFLEVQNKFIQDQGIKSALARICGIIGLPPSQASGFMGSILVAHMLKNQQYYFKSRSQDLSNAFVQVIEENNGTMLCNKTVTSILTEGNRVSGVQTEDGATYPARIVVSNANAPDTFGRFLSHNDEAKKYMQKLAQYEPSISSFIVWLGLKGELRGKVAGHSVRIDSGYDIETDFRNYLKCDAEKCPVMLAVYDNYYKGYSRPGTSTLTIMIFSGYEPWRRFEKDYFAGNKKEYYREKERIARTLIKRVEEKVIPGLSSMIQVMEAATPLTNVRFTRNPGGAIYGYPASVDNAFMNRIENSTPIDGLYLSSGWGNNAGSYTGGIMNGRDVYRRIMKDV